MALFADTGSACELRGPPPQDEPSTPDDELRSLAAVQIPCSGCGYLAATFLKCDYCEKVTCDRCCQVRSLQKGRCVFCCSDVAPGIDSHLVLEGDGGIVQDNRLDVEVAQDSIDEPLVAALRFAGGGTWHFEGQLKVDEVSSSGDRSEVADEKESPVDQPETDADPQSEGDETPGGDDDNGSQ